MQSTNIVLFTSQDKEISLSVSIEGETVWLSLDQLSSLFKRDKSSISRHITNIFKEGELERDSVVANFATTAADGKTYDVTHFNLDTIISVGYRVKSHRGVEFRKWATGVLRSYLLRGRAENEARLRQLGEIAELIERLPEQLEQSQILDVVRSYTKALDMLDDYDHQRISKPAGADAIYSLTYKECKQVIEDMRFGTESTLFGNEKDGSFKSSISSIYQSFDGVDLYPSLEEKAANLLYFVVKNHSFTDGNKRIAAALFLHFLNMNNALFEGQKKRISDETLVAITIMIAESKPAEKEIMVALVMNFLI